MARRNEVDILIKAKDQASKKLRDVEDQSDRLDNSLKSLAVTAGAFFSAAAIGAGAARAIKSSSDLRESVNAVNVVFAEGADTVLEFGKNSATAVGLAQSEFNQLSAVTGALLKDTGLAMTDVAERTNMLAVRAADMASVMNTTVQDALSAVNQALRGETEAIRRYTGDVTDASLQQFLLSQDIDKAVSKMTEQEKRLGRLSLILAQTDKFADDFANTNKELANQQRIAAANIENFSAKIGKTFLPVISEGIRLFNEFITSFGKSDFDRAIEKLKDLGDATNFIETLELTRAIRKEAEKRVGIGQEIRNFAVEERLLLNQRTGEQVKLNEGLQSELETLVSNVKHTKDISQIQEFLGRVESKRRDNLEKINAVYSEGLDVNESLIDTLTGVDLSLVNISSQAARFLTLLNEEKAINEAINSLLKERQDIDKKAVDIKEKEREFRKEELTEAERIKGIRGKETEEINEQLAIKNKGVFLLEKEIELRNDVAHQTTEQILRENQAFVILNEFGPALARAVVEGENLKEVLDQILRQLATRALLGLIGAGVGFAVTGGTAAGAQAGFNIGFGAPVFNAQHGDSGVFPGQGNQERPFWGIARPGEPFQIGPPGQQSKVVNVFSDSDRVTMSRGAFRNMMREFGAEVFFEDMEMGKY